MHERAGCRALVGGRGGDGDGGTMSFFLVVFLRRSTPPRAHVLFIYVSSLRVTVSARLIVVFSFSPNSCGPQVTTTHCPALVGPSFNT